MDFFEQKQTLVIKAINPYAFYLAFFPEFYYDTLLLQAVSVWLSLYILGPSDVSAGRSIAQIGTVTTRSCGHSHFDDKRKGKK
jgi:hypothetical protein